MHWLGHIFNMQWFAWNTVFNVFKRIERNWINPEKNPLNYSSENGLTKIDWFYYHRHQVYSNLILIDLVLEICELKLCYYLPLDSSKIDSSSFLGKINFNVPRRPVRNRLNFSRTFFGSREPLNTAMMLLLPLDIEADNSRHSLKKNFKNALEL